MTQKIAAWLLVLCLFPLCAFAQEAAGSALPGFVLSRTEEDGDAEGFEAQMKNALLSLNAVSADAEQPSDRLAVKTDRLLTGPSPAEGLLSRAVGLCLSEAFEENDAFAQTLARLIDAARIPAADGAEESFLFMPPSGETDGASFIGVIGADRFVSLFSLEESAADGPRVAGQLVFTEWGVTIGQSNPEIGVIRPDGSFAVLAPGETRIVLMDCAGLALLDSFTLTVLPAGAEPSLIIDPADALTLKVGDTQQLTVLLEIPESDSPLSLITRISPDEAVDSVMDLPEALRDHAQRCILIPSAQMPPAGPNALPQRVLQILG